MKPSLSEKHWFKLTVENCQLQPNSARPRTQTHQILAGDADEAQRLAPEVLKYLWSPETRIVKCEMFV